MFERHHEPVIPHQQFLRRVLGSVVLAFGVVCASLGLGVLGYHFIAGLPWVDAFLNASMILGGMGPVDAIVGTAAKLFAGCYALFSGIVFLTTAAILFAPLVHRLLHHFHRHPADGN